MARLHNMFEFTGSVGNLIFYYYRGKLCVRTKPVHKNKTVSPAQAINQKKFMKATEFVRSLTPLINTTIKQHKHLSKPVDVTYYETGPFGKLSGY